VSNAASFGYVLLAFALAFGGGALGVSVGHSHRRLCALISIGAGSLLGVTLFAILPEAYAAMQWWSMLLSIGSGYFLFSIITKYVSHVCPACAASHFDQRTMIRFSEIATGMSIALAIHCLADGLAMAAGHEAHITHGASGRVIDFSLIAAVCVHKVPEGLALGSLLVGAGLSRGKVLARVAAIESTTVIGGAAGLFLLRGIPDFWLAAAVAHAGGGFLFLVIHAVGGELLENHKRLVVTNFSIGFALIGAICAILHFL
jgi:zinc transporter ZupT